MPWLAMTESVVDNRTDGNRSPPQVARSFLGVFSAPPESSSRQRLARLPEPSRRRVVARGGGTIGDLAVGEIFAAEIGGLGRRGEIDDRVGALLWGDREPFGERDQPTEPPAGLVAEPRGDEAGVQAIGDDARPGEPPREFAREKNVGELRAPVDL